MGMIDHAFAAPGRFYKGNLHTHSTRSDGAREPADVARLYAGAGYDFISLTDHFQAKFGFPIVDTTTLRTSTFTTLFGAELHAPATAMGETWHILAVGLPLDFAPTGANETGAELAARALAAGAFVALPHPEWYNLQVRDADTIAGAHAIEIYNHTSALRTGRGGGVALTDALHASGRRIGIIACDDAHLHCDDAFGGFVMVKAEANEPAALLAALKAGHYYASQGPTIDSVVYGDDHVEVRCSKASAVILLGRGSRAAQIVEPGITHARLATTALAKSPYLRIVVQDERGRAAWTNAVWR